MESISRSDSIYSAAHREHPLLTKKAAGAFALLALPAIGIALISVKALLVGFLLSGLGSIGIIWLYWRDFSPSVLGGKEIPTSMIERVVAVIFLLISVIVPIYAYDAIVSDEREKTAAQQKTEMAHRWIRLSDEILSDINLVKPDFRMPPLDQSMSGELRNKLWAEESQRMLDAFSNGLSVMAKKYFGRLSEAKIEMENLNIPMTESGQRLDAPLVNAFSWEAWASKLGGEGRRILTERGETP